MPSRRRFLLSGAAIVATSAPVGNAVRQAMRAQPSRLRPPGAVVEHDFLAACIRCEQCIVACPVGCLKPVSWSDDWFQLGAPHIVARETPCNLCAGRERMECIEVCPTAALQPVAAREEVRMGLARIDEQTCLPFLGVTCRACWHACPYPTDAIAFDARGRPLVLADGCVGCGLCEHACLAERPAIRIEPFGHGTSHT
ncbi:MAG: 4Fe-4S dicluster domain-containing protein [Planctomycetales bacterium]|nr:4Fe-4S dicluster domain-containing protein [Planctomycetales bacterium]